MIIIALMNWWEGTVCECVCVCVTGCDRLYVYKNFKNLIFMLLYQQSTEISNIRIHLYVG